MSSKKKKLKRIKKILRQAERGDFAVKGRDFGRGVAFIVREIRGVTDAD